MNIRDKIVECMEASGIFLDEKAEDYDFRDSNVDSMRFIAFIIELEKELNLTFPDYMVNYESFCSLNSVARFIEETIRDKTDNK